MPALETYDGVFLWRYIPSLPLATTFGCLFGFATIAHGWKMITTRMWFCLPFVIGGIFEEIGYIARASATNHTGSLALYLLQAIFLLLPPIFFAASLYMTYARVVRAVHGEAFSPISPRWTTRIFVVADFLCLSVQSDGSGLLSKQKTTLVGDYIIVAGLGLQILVFVGFVLCCLVFGRRFRAHVVETGTEVVVPWRSYLVMLCLTSLAILVRNVYRMAEFIMGQDGYLLSNEWPTYVFDAALMFLVMGGFLAWYPDQLKVAEGDEVVELTATKPGPGRYDDAAEHSNYEL